jgi:NADH-quinone oxidoreductase subunit H
MAEGQALMLNYAFNYIVFPGFLFTAAAGMLASWLDRKLTARVQWRVGPPLLQPWYDIRKLFLKETVLPSGGNVTLFVLAPVIALAAVTLVSNMTAYSFLRPDAGFSGDLIVVLYVLTLLPLCSILGASASANPLASVGASREMKLILSYELPLLLSVSVAAIKARSLSLGEIIAFQQSFGSVSESASGFIAFLVAILCLQGKMGLAPFDLAEAETELAGGSQIEYSGPLLAFWKLTRMMLFVAGPLFIIELFWGGGNPWLLPLKYLVAVVIAVLIRNTNPRVRVDQAVKFFWGKLTLLALLSLALLAAGW